MIIISDSSCIINLAKINRLGILPDLFIEINIPAAVFKEITNDRKNELSFSHVLHAGWFKVIKAKDILLKAKLEKDLDEGEAEAIVIALELNADLIIIDELKGREIARQFNLKYTGLLGILLIAKEKGLIQQIEPELKKLKQEGFWMSNDLYNEVLRMSGEK